eukprot:3364270-Amphidinium_carterae.1
MNTMWRSYPGQSRTFRPNLPISGYERRHAVAQSKGTMIGEYAVGVGHDALSMGLPGSHEDHREHTSQGMLRNAHPHALPYRHFRVFQD